MASTTTTPLRRSEAPSPNGSMPRSSPATLSPPRSRVRTPELVVGVLVMTVFALGAVMWHLSAVHKSPALAVSSKVERGEEIRASDLRIVFVASDDSLARLGAGDTGDVVGKVALVDLAPGTLVTKSVVADRPGLETGDGVVGLSLEPGGYPAMGLAPGDRVNVIGTVDAAAPTDENTDADTPEDAAKADGVVARGATVIAVEELSSDRLLVSIVTSESDAEAVAARSGSGALRLVQVSP